MIAHSYRYRREILQRTPYLTPADWDGLRLLPRVFYFRVYRFYRPSTHRQRMQTTTTIPTIRAARRLLHGCTESQYKSLVRYLLHHPDEVEHLRRMICRKLCSSELSIHYAEEKLMKLEEVIHDTS